LLAQVDVLTKSLQTMQTQLEASEARLQASLEDSASLQLQLRGALEQLRKRRRGQRSASADVERASSDSGDAIHSNPEPAESGSPPRRRSPTGRGSPTNV
jgi:regulator of replication initiation timing